MNAAASTLASMFDNVQSIRNASAAGVPGFKAMIHRVSRIVISQWDSRLKKAMSAQVDDTPIQESSVELAQIARVRTWRPEAYKSLPWQDAKHQIICGYCSTEN